MLSKQIIINELNIHYFQSKNFNNGIILLHGWKSEAWHLKNIFEKLDNYLAIDLPGFGKSDAPKEPWGVGEYANFLKNFFKKLKIDPLIFIGHSFGASIIIKYLSLGGRAKKIFLIGSAGLRPKNFKKIFYNYIAKIFKIIFIIPGLKFFREKIRRKFYNFINSFDYLDAGILIESYKKIINEDLSKDISKINIPTILIWGSLDKETPLIIGEKMNNLIKNSKLLIVPNAGHFPFIDQKEKFLELFLKEL